MANDQENFQELWKTKVRSNGVPPFGLEMVRSTLLNYHKFRQASSRPASWEDIRDDIYASEATMLFAPDDFFYVDGSQPDNVDDELQDEALRRFALGITKTLRNHEHFLAVIDFLVAEKFLRHDDLTGPEPSHHLRCRLSNVLGIFCFQQASTDKPFIGDFHCVARNDDNGLVETILSIVPAPGPNLLETKELSLIFNGRPRERNDFVEGRRFRLEFDEVVVRFGTATLSCKKSLLFSFSELDDQARKVEASIATMRNVAFVNNDDDDLVATSFELHGDHPLYDQSIATFKRIEGKELLNRKRRLEAKLARWHRRT